MEGGAVVPDSVIANALFDAYGKALHAGQDAAALTLLEELVKLGSAPNCSRPAGDTVTEALLIGHCYFETRQSHGPAGRAFDELCRLALRPSSSLMQRMCLGEAAVAASRRHARSGQSQEREMKASSALQALPEPPEALGEPQFPQGLPIYDLYWTIVAQTVGDPARQAQELWAAVQALNEAGKLMEQLCVCELIVRQFSTSGDGTAISIASSAMFVIASSFANQGNRTMEMAIYDDLLERFGRPTPVVAVVLFNKALRLTESGDMLTAMRTYGHLVDVFQNASDSISRGQVAMALVNRAGVFFNQGRPDLALPDFELLLQRFGQDQGDDMRRQCAIARSNRALALTQLTRFDEALADIDQIVRDFSHVRDPQIESLIANCVETRALILQKLGRQPSHPRG